jgi:hypothetical protein
MQERESYIRQIEQWRDLQVSREQKWREEQRKETMPNPFVIPATVRCAGPNCENVKREQNHWFVIDPRPLCGIVVIYDGVQLIFDELDMKHDGEATRELLPACGESCLLKLISSLIKKEKP